ncbi:MAG TPA: glycosyltransferase family 39 protein [Pararobbsia sp.]|nr:glycosyltransferase family 39 protein [Pararobbsia sp.]
MKPHLSNAASTATPVRHLDAGAPDDTRKARQLIWLLPYHALVWTIAAWLSRGNLDIQGDMIENYVWGIEWRAGYAKHPPLFAWITAAWFRVFPHVDIAYFALSALNAMVGLLGIVALARRFLPRQLAIVAGLAMAVSPLYSNLAIKFNANSVLLSIWPWTAYYFVRFMQTGGWRCGLALGALAGAAVLGKYFSIVLLLALMIAAIVRPSWRRRLLSWHALPVAVAGFVVLLPHLHWLVVNDFPTFGYAHERTGGALSEAAARFGIYTAAQVGYLALSFCFVVLLAPVGRIRVAGVMASAVLRPSRHADLWWLAIGPLIVVGMIALAARTQMASVWGMAQWFAIVPLWLVAARDAGATLEPRRVEPILMGYWVLVLVATSIVGYVGALHNKDDAAEPRAELAAAAHALWTERTGHDIPIVAGSTHEAQSIAFYSDGHTRYWDIGDPRGTPWLSADDVRRNGALFVCQENDDSCVSASGAFSHALPVPVEVHKQAWGRSLAARRYWLFVMLPAS